MVIQVEGIYENEIIKITQNIVLKREREIKLLSSPKQTIEKLNNAIKSTDVTTIGGGWYFGDLHMHSHHSEHETLKGVFPPKIHEIAEKANDFLDFVAITDHSVDINNGLCGIDQNHNWIWCLGADE